MVIIDPLSTLEAIREQEAEKVSGKEVCDCGNVYAREALFCRKCGVLRETRCPCGEWFQGHSTECAACSQPRFPPRPRGLWGRSKLKASSIYGNNH
jgi:hypothetical protein